MIQLISDVIELGLQQSETKHMSKTGLGEQAAEVVLQVCLSKPMKGSTLN